MDNNFRMMIEGQMQRDAAGDVSTRQNGFLLNILPRIPGGDTLWGIGSRVWFGVKRICGMILGIFGSENIPNKAEMFLQKFTEDLKNAADADHRRLAQESASVRIEAIRSQLASIGPAQNAHSAEHGLERVAPGGSTNVGLR